MQPSLEGRAPDELAAVLPGGDDLECHALLSFPALLIVKLQVLQVVTNKLLPLSQVGGDHCFGLASCDRAGECGLLEIE